MALKINLQNNINNTSLQIGDMAYFITPTTSVTEDGSVVTLPNSFTTEGDSIILKIGKITKVTSSYIQVETPINTPNADDFIMFSKDKSVNNTSLLGYYAKVKLVNNSTEKAELFALGSEITASSK
jgi:hypothetical protein|tara:strand:- start:466 stop:843 length:378 start_codon:yes stop_codon:yes gene_type:complete